MVRRVIWRGSKTYIFTQTSLFENLRNREGGTDTHDMWWNSDDLKNRESYQRRNVDSKADKDEVE